MRQEMTETKLPTYIKFLVYISLIEIFFSFLLDKLGFQKFQMIPYLRLVVLFFSAMFFSLSILNNRKLFKLRITKNSENVLMLVWFAFSIIGILVGILNLNPIIYFISDFVYILFGYVLYRIFLTDKILSNEIKLSLNIIQEKKLIFYFIFNSILAIILNVEIPSFFVIFALVYSLYFFSEKKYLKMIMCIMPFLFQLLTANRALLLVYIFILFFYITQNSFTKKNISNLLFSVLILLIISSFFISDFLKFILDNIPENSNVLRDRINQIYLIFIGKANWESSSMLSLKQRIDEASIVVSFWFSNPINFFFGGGMGATIEGYVFKDAGVINSALLGKSAIHNIHLLPFSLIFRYGLFGFIIFINLMYNLIKYFVRTIVNDNPQLTIMICFQFCWILYSMPASSYLWTSPFFWITLAFISNEKKIFNS